MILMGIGKSVIVSDYLILSDRIAVRVFEMVLWAHHNSDLNIHPQIQPTETTSLQSIHATAADETESESRIESGSSHLNTEDTNPLDEGDDYYDKMYNDLIGKGGDYNEKL